MNTPENAPVESSPADWRSQCRALERQNSLLLTGLVALSLILMGYLFIQSRRAGKDLQQLQTEIQRVTKSNVEHEKRLKNVMGVFSQFAQTNQDFQKVFAANEQAINDFLNRRTNAPPATQ